MAVSRRPNVIGRICQVGAALLFSTLFAAAQTSPAAVDWLPAGAVYAFQVNQPAALQDIAENLKILDMFLGGSTDPGYRLLVDTLGKKSGTDFKGLIRQFTAGGITYAVYPGESSVWIFDTQSPVVLDAFQQFVKVLAGARAGVPVTTPASTKPAAIFYQEYPGNVASWSLDGKQFFARTGNRLIVANRGDVLKALFSPRTPGSLAASPLYSQARQAVGPNPAAWAFVNMAILNQYPPAKKALVSHELFDLVLDGAVKQSLADSTWLAMGLGIDGKKLLFHAATDGKLAATGAGAFTRPGDTGVLPNLKVPRELAAITLWRDLGQFYAQKEALFPEKTSGGILAENFLEIFFTGRDLNEVFGRFQPQVRLVVARQQYDPAIGTPVEQYPAAALIFRVEHNAEDFGEVLEEAWQKAIGLTNFTRGQSAEPGTLIDRESYGGVTFSCAAFSVRGEKDRAHLASRFNYRPSIVRDGPYIILSSTDGLAKDLIDAVNKEDARNPAQRSNAHTVIEVTSPPEIAALLNLNRTALIRQSVLSSGKKPEQAAREFDQNTAWLNKLDHARLSISATPEGHQADLELDLK
jgi:hypothetical protein